MAITWSRTVIAGDEMHEDFMAKDGERRIVIHRRGGMNQCTRYRLP
jgi:hypothetical protein